MPSNLRNLMLSALIAWAAALPAAGAGAAADVVPEALIAELIGMVRTEPEDVVRTEYAARLAEYIAARGAKSAELDAPVIDEIAKLLSDRNDWIRFYAAASLGFIGPAARRAIPALENALNRASGSSDFEPGPRVFTELNSAAAICAALVQIDLSRIPRDCDGYR